MSKCIWCNEIDVVKNGIACESCPTIPYKCTCDGEIRNTRHNVFCERSPNFIGERKLYPEMEALYGVPDGTKWVQSGDHSDFIPDPSQMVETIRSVLSGLNNYGVIPRYKLESCEQDPDDPTRLVVKFRWYKEA